MSLALIASYWDGPHWDFWRLHDAYSILQAAALVAGLSPSDIQFDQDDSPFMPDNPDHDEDWPSRSSSFTAAYSAITTAVQLGKLVSRSRYGKSDNSTHPANSLILVDDLKEWLREKRLRPGFFFDRREETPNYLDKRHPRYAPKLAAAIRAWEEVGDVEGTSVKDALKKWINEHAVEFELTKENGVAPRQTVEEIAKVANWQREGGAPRTPSRK